MSTTEAVEQVEERAHYRVTFSVILVATMSYAMLQSLVLPVLPTIQTSLHTTQSTVTWVLTAYLLSASVATPIVGRLGDMIGKKKTLVAVLVVLAVGTLLAAIASSIGIMIIARVIQGAGGAVLPLAFGIIRDEFPPERVASAVSTTAALLAVGGGLGIVLAGPIVDALDYHFLFWIPLVFIVIAAVAAHFVIPESRDTSPGRISLLPAALMTGWLVALLVAVSEGSEWGWLSGRTVGLLVLAVVLIVVWVVSEVRATQPLVDMKMMRLPAVWTTNLVALLFGVGMYSVMAFLPEFLQTPSSNGYGFGASITSSGIYLLPMTVTMFFFGLWSGRLTAQFGSKFVLLVGSAVTVAPLGILTFAHHQEWVIYVVSGLLGIGLGFAFAAMSNIIVESVPPSQTGVASGMNANIRTIGGSIGAAVMGSIVTSGTAAGGIPHEAGYTHGFLFLFVGAAIATAAAVIIPTAHKRGRDADADVQHALEADGVHIVRNAEAAMVAGAPLVEVE
ncbi:MFS transporter [Jatrophihabitans sp.]|uniref:MFS transporter n=1 Tax=Jatrophihabitans sp. TaxID=1932789 RepID=UPI0030C6E7C0|nr:major facilitator superfamily 1 [Jatrophihabitans sp.]